MNGQKNTDAPGRAPRAASPAIRLGAGTVCPGCGERTVIVKASRMEGWQVAGWELKCPLCGYVFGPCDPAGRLTVGPPGAADGDAGVSQAEERLAGAAAALGLDDAEMDSGDKELLRTLRKDARRFCRDCRYYLKHPFRSRCLLHNRDVGPMDDCGDFAPGASADSPAEERC